MVLYDRKKLIETMNGLDVSICLDFAQRVDPRRGERFMDAFMMKAVQLGYSFNGDLSCHCDSVCVPQCGMSRPHVQSSPWPYDTTVDNPDGIAIPNGRVSPPAYLKHLYQDQPAVSEVCGDTPRADTDPTAV